MRSRRRPPTPTEPTGAGVAVRLEGLTHYFAGRAALSGLDLEVPHHRITVVLGPNGAGKTTAIRAITGALTPQYGNVTTFGLDPRRHGGEIRRRCGVVSAKPALYDRLSGLDNLRYSAELYGMGRAPDLDRRMHEAADRFGIVDALGDLVGGYSTGMKTRLALARSVLHDPELLLFDEPTSGLDPESAHAVLDLIREMTAGGRTVLMCTHLLAEAEGLADHIVVMDSGRALVSGTPMELTDRYWTGIPVVLDTGSPTVAPILSGLAGVQGVETDTRRLGTGVEVRVDDERVVPDLVAALVAAGHRVRRVEPRLPSLEDLYFAIRRGPTRPHPPEVLVTGDLEAPTHQEVR